MMVTPKVTMMVTMVVTIISHRQGNWTGVKIQTRPCGGLVAGNGDPTDFAARKNAGPNKVLKGWTIVNPGAFSCRRRRL